MVRHRPRCAYARQETISRRVGSRHRVARRQRADPDVHPRAAGCAGTASDHHRATRGRRQGCTRGPIGPRAACATGRVRRGLSPMDARIGGTTCRPERSRRSSCSHQPSRKARTRRRPGQSHHRPAGDAADREGKRRASGCWGADDGAPLVYGVQIGAAVSIARRDRRQAQSTTDCAFAAAWAARESTVVARCRLGSSVAMPALKRVR
jgi:hypothetical protein